MLKADEHESAKQRLGWVPTEERDWTPFGQNGSSPPKKSPPKNVFAKTSNSFV
jgi:hypothetical protein